MPNLGERLRAGLSEDIMNQISDIVGDDFDWDLVPRSRLNQVIKQRNDLRSQQAQVGGGTPSPSNTDPVPPAQGGSEEDVQKQIDKAVKEALKKKDDEILEMEKRHAATDMLNRAEALDAEVILKGGLIDLSKMTKDDKGAWTGIDDQIESLKGSKGFLFGANKAPAGTGKGTSGSEEGGTDALDAQLANIFGDFDPIDSSAK